MACRHGRKDTRYNFYAAKDGTPIRLHMHGNDAFSGLLPLPKRLVMLLYNDMTQSLPRAALKIFCRMSETIKSCQHAQQYTVVLGTQELSQL